MANILIVDDEKSIRFTINEFLKEENHKIFTSEDAFSALEILKKNQINLIISDIMLPRIKGTDLIFTIQAMYPKIKFILITGYANNESKEIGKKAGIFAYLEKPVSKKIICETVSNALK